MADDVTYTIGADEALAGPKPVNPNLLFDPQPEPGKPAEASIEVHADKVVGHVNPLVFGACFEDLNHEIYGGLYAQMIFGESFEEGPEKGLPPGWRFHADWLNRPTWEGMWWSENDAVGMTGFRSYRLLWQGVNFGDGRVECEMMQPDFDLGRPIGLVFRASGREYADHYSIMLDAVRDRLELRIGERVVAGAKAGVGPGQWVRVAAEMTGGEVRVFAGDNAKPVIHFTDAKPLLPGLVGFDASETHGQFRKLRIDTGGRSYVPPLAPVRPVNWRGPVSQWWDAVVTGDAEVAFGWDADKPFNTLRSQRIQIRSGNGTAGVANRGLGRLGLSVIKAGTYSGRLYLRGDYLGQVTVALQNADGSKTYAADKVTDIGTDWKKFPFTLKPDATDHDARFAVWIDRPGTVWVDQIVLMPTGDGLFAGLPVRADLAKAVVDSGVTCIRLGGDYSGPPGYKWKTMLGDPDRRPQYNSCWYPFESRGWGIVEFIEFCRAAGIEPIPCLNQDESAADVAELVGRFHLKYVQLGNGCPPPQRLAAVADAIHAVAPDAKLLSGSIGHEPAVLPDGQRLQQIKETLGGKVHAMAMFPYNFEVTGPSSWQAMLDRLAPLRGTMKVYAQEVNGGNHDLLRGLADAAFANVTEQNADFVDLVTYCGMVEANGTSGDNGWDQGRIFFDNHRVWLQPHAWSVRMAREHYQPLAVETTSRGPKMTFKKPIHYGVPVVDVLSASAARSEKGDVLALKVVNFAPFAVKARIDIASVGKLAPTARTVLLTGNDLKLENTAEQPDRVAPVNGQRDGIGPEFFHVFPGYSYTILDLQSQLPIVNH
jgi:hypothetical protein